MANRVSGTDRSIFSPFLTFHDGALDVRNNSLGGRNIVLKLRNDDVGVGNDGVRVCDIVADVGNDRLGV